MKLGPRYVTASLAACATLVVGIGSTVAVANLRDDEGLVFKGRTIEVSDGGVKQLDPINLLFMGGADRQFTCPASGCLDPNGNDVSTTICDSTTHETAKCIALILKHGDIEHGCPGTQYAIMRNNADPYIRVRMSLSRSDNQICGNQMHVRAFSDEGHGHSRGQNQWMIGAVHRERVPFRRPWAGHELVGSWESAEQRAEDRIARVQCTYKDSVRLPGSGGNIRGRFSDGRMTRISMKRKARNRPRGEWCTGG